MEFLRRKLRCRDLTDKRLTIFCVNTLKIQILSSICWLWKLQCGLTLFVLVKIQISEG